jgi:N-acetylneuraminic acid mutarotase
MSDELKRVVMLAPAPVRRTSIPLKITLLSAAMALGMLACTSEETLTQPGTAGDQSMATSSLALASNTWTTKAPYPGPGLFGGSAAMAPNSAGQSIVYLFGGTDGAGGTVFPVHAYNVATNTWTTKTSHVGVFNSNGVGKIGSRLYFSGGYNAVESPPSFTNLFWAYDYSHDQMVRKADLPIFGAEGVTGVINGKLYVLPGACSGDRYPDLPGYCAQEPTRRFFRYDPATNAWLGRRSAPHFHRSGAGGVINGKFYVAGGFNGFQPVAQLDVYDPVANTWTTLAPIPTAGRAIGAALGGKLFVIVGEGSELHSYVYNPATNTWTTRASPTLGHDAVVRVTLDGTSRLLAVGGFHPPNGDIPNDTELYTP